MASMVGSPCRDVCRFESCRPSHRSQVQSGSGADCNLGAFVRPSGSRSMWSGQIGRRRTEFGEQVHFASFPEAKHCRSAVWRRKYARPASTTNENTWWLIPKWTRAYCDSSTNQFPVSKSYRTMWDGSSKDGASGYNQKGEVQVPRIPPWVRKRQQGVA